MRHGWFVGLVIAWSAPGVLAALTQDIPLPEPAPGWKIERIAEGPAFAHVNALVAAEDRVFLGQNAAVLSYLNGKMAVFAETLGRIHGLEWIDGTLFLIHGSSLSALRDTDGDGRTDRREDLVTDLGPKPHPEDPLDDHGVGGIRLGPD